MGSNLSRWSLKDRRRGQQIWTEITENCPMREKSSPELTRMLMMAKQRPLRELPNLRRSWPLFAETQRRVSEPPKRSLRASRRNFSSRLTLSQEDWLNLNPD